MPAILAEGGVVADLLPAAELDAVQLAAHLEESEDLDDRLRARTHTRARCERGSHMGAAP